MNMDTPESRPGYAQDLFESLSWTFFFARSQPVDQTQNAPLDVYKTPAGHDDNPSPKGASPVGRVHQKGKWGYMKPRITRSRMPNVWIIYFTGSGIEGACFGLRRACAWAAEYMAGKSAIPPAESPSQP